MKKVFGLMLMVLATFGVTSCTTGDNAIIDPGQLVIHTVAEEIAGKYDGWTDASAAYFSGMVSDGDKVDISLNDDGTVNVTYTSSTWGTAIINNVVVEKLGSGYALSSGEGTITMSMSGKETKEYACLFSGASISTNLEIFIFEFSAPSVMGGTTMTFYSGEAPASLLVPGSYEGWTSASSAYFKAMNNNGDKVVITANEDGTVNVTYTSVSWGEATFKNVVVNKTDAGFTFTASGESTILMPGMGGNEAKEYAAIMESGVLSTDLQTYTFVFSAPSVMGGTTMTFQNGTAPEEEAAPEGDKPEKPEGEKPEGEKPEGAPEGGNVTE